MSRTIYYPGKHCVQIMAAKGIDWAQILHVLEAPTVQYVNPATPDREPGRTSERDGVYVVTQITPERGVRRRKPEDFTLLKVLTCGTRRPDIQED